MGKLVETLCLKQLAVALPWFLTVALWPLPSNLPTREEPKSASLEGLYKSPLTTANFGLLGVQFFETNDGKKHWNIRAQFAELHRKENYAYLQAVDADFYAERTGNVVNAKSEYGRSWIEKRLVALEGNVKVRSKQGYLFTMDRLDYHGENHSFTSEDRVQMRGPSVEKPTTFLRGTGLQADIDREHFVLRRNVNAQKKLKTGEWLKVQSRAGEFFTNDQKAAFSGSVHSQLPNITMESDALDIHTTQDQESLFAKGHVVLQSKDRVGHADRAEIEIGSNKIVLEGAARVDAKDNQILGRRITLYTDDDRIEVEEAQGRLSQ